MSQLSYYGTPEPLVRHRGGLIAWGIVLIAGGSLLSCGGIFGMAGMAIMATQGTGSATTPALVRGVSGLIVAIGMYGALIWLGIGCCMGKRWTRPLVLVGSVMAIAFGVVSVGPMTWASVTMILHATSSAAATTAPLAGSPSGPPPIFIAIASVVGVAAMLAMLIILPAFMIYFFRQETVRQSLEMTDPTPRWTDGIPLPLLGWVIGCMLLGLGDLSQTLSGIYPFFNSISTGPMAILVQVILGLLLVVGGVLSYRRSPFGWLLAFTALVFTAASECTFVALGDTALYRHLLLSGFGAAAQKSAESSPFTSSSLSPMLIAAMVSTLAVAYGIWLLPRMKQNPSTAVVRGSDGPV